MAATTTYKCRKCGTRLVVTEKMESHLSPVYCCGAEVARISSVRGKTAKPKKKIAKKKAVKKKKPAKGKGGK